MILTVTLNPSVDIAYNLSELTINTTNRVSNVSKTAGGKGLNVTRVLNQLGEQVAATGFLGGELGQFISKEITEIGVENHFVPIKNDTRNCIGIIHDGNQTEILEEGPEICKKEAELFLERYSKSLNQINYVTISGSLPKGLDAKFYTNLLKMAHEKRKPVLLDTSGESLKQALIGKYKPFLIKPNIEELAEVLDREIDSKAQVLEALKEKIFEDIPWIVVTIGADGAIVKRDKSIYYAKIPKVKAVNPVGSGDSVIAGLAAGLNKELFDESFIKYGLSMGVLNAMEEQSGFINPDNIEWCIEQIVLEKE